MSILMAMLLCAAPQSLTADEILARHAEARGGLARLRALQSVRMTGKLVSGGDDFSVESQWAQLQKRPGMVRRENTLQGLTAVESWDGVEGWMVRPFGGRKDPQRQSADESRGLARDGDLESPLIDART